MDISGPLVSSTSPETSAWNFTGAVMYAQLLPPTPASETTAVPMSAEIRGGLIALYALTATAATIGNLMVIIVFAVGKRSRTDLRDFLINLAVADLMMAMFCMPFTFTATMMNRWVFGSITCPLVLYVQVSSGWRKGCAGYVRSAPGAHRGQLVMYCNIE